VIFEHFESIEKPLRKKKTRWPSTDCRASNLRFNNAGRLLSYLIGQQRQQSMPHRAAKSSANLSNGMRKTMY
jgi:hypothetical protein